MTWEEYYNQINNWEFSNAERKLSALENIGPTQEVIDVMNILGFEDKKAGTGLLKKALQAGLIFTGEDLVYIYDVCEEEIFFEALKLSGKNFTAKDLEDLYGVIDDEVLVQTAKAYNLPIPEAIREEYEAMEEEEDIEEEYEEEFYEMENIREQIRYAIEAADYAVNCLEGARAAFEESSGISVIDMFSDSNFSSLIKYSSLQEAENELREAVAAIEGLNSELRALLQNKSVRLSAVKLSSVIDMWFDSKFMDYLVHMQIGKVQKRINRAISQIIDIKRELVKML